MSYQIGGFTVYVPRDAVEELKGVSVEDLKVQDFDGGQYVTALVKEAESLIKDASAELGELREPSPPPATGSDAGRAERRPSLTRHRFSKRLSPREAQSARRVITLRDKRSRKPGLNRQTRQIPVRQSTIPGGGSDDHLLQ